MGVSQARGFAARFTVFGFRFLVRKNEQKVAKIKKR
jgi:hypothetical protein